MVSFWPWKGDDNSAASFEKTLSGLSTKITNANVKRDTLKTRSRRWKALWTLYTSFAYILYSLILVLVTGHNNWGIVEYAAVAGGPVIIYAVRYSISAFYDYRVNHTQSQINALTKQKDTAVEKFKEATKYNTTQKLLEKYDAAPKAKTPGKSNDEKRKGQAQNGISQGPQPGRTNLPPPPTANIRRAGDHNMPITPPQPPQQMGMMPQAGSTGDLQTPPGFSPPPGGTGAEFAPNAFPSSPQYSEAGFGQPKWYDRIMDVLLGEDETRPINRLALICQHCKLVNGQAPPGVKSLKEVGKWRCTSCHGWNGEADEVQSIIEDVAKEQQPLESPSSEDDGVVKEDLSTEDVHKDVKAEDNDDEDYAEPPARATRSRAKAP